MRTVDIIRGIVSGKIEELGYSLYDVEFTKQPEGYILVITIDSPNGVMLADCEQVSRAIEPLIDEKDPIEQSYCLCVSSIGIDRPIKDDRDFKRNIGTKIDVKLYAPINKQKQFSGELTAFCDETFTITDKDGKECVIPRKAAASVVPHIDFE